MHRVAARALPGLRPKALAKLSAKHSCPVSTYRSICVGARAVDLREDPAEPIRRTFNGFYGVRRNSLWRECFYNRFEFAKSSDLIGRSLFSEVVEGLHSDTGRVEASFVSKMVATVRPDCPIIDSVVRNWLSRHAMTPPFNGGTQGVVEYYNWLCDFMPELLETDEAHAWGDAFEAAFPTYQGQVAITRMKQLDFLIWAGADR